jgi:oligosaccharide repeat unit polymerase
MKNLSQLIVLSFILPWTTVLILYYFELSAQLLPFDIEVALYILLTILFLQAGSTINIIREISIKNIYDKNEIDNKKIISIEKKIKYISFIMIIGYSYEIFYFKNLPLLSSFGIGEQIRYTEFGFKGLHGLFNALYLTVSNILFYVYIQKKYFIKSKDFIIIILLILWPILLEGRQLFVSLILQNCLIYMIVKGVSKNSLLKLFITLSLLILFFGYIGDIRSGREGILRVALPTFDYPEFLPSALLWVYIYVCSPFSNLTNNYYDIQPNYLPINILSSLFPSNISEDVKIFLGGDSYQWKLVHEVLNVSSIHQKLLIDFGAYISIGLFFLIGMYIKYLWIKRNKDLKYLLNLIIICHGLTLSIFGDFIFNLVFIFQIISSYLIFLKIKR